MSYPYETLLPTDQAKLSRLDGPSRVPSDLPTKVQQLKMLGISMDFDEIQRTLQEVVPEYRPMTPVRQPAATPRSSALGDMQTTTLDQSERVWLSLPPLPIAGGAGRGAHLDVLAGHPGAGRAVVERGRSIRTAFLIPFVSGVSRLDQAG